jgi:hypothetical protein
MHVAHIPRYARSLLLIGAALGSSLSAQDLGFSKDLKIRTGYGLSTQDNLRASSLGFGFNVSYGLPVGKLGVELGYYYKTGDQYIEPVNGAAPAPLSSVNLDKSGDSRRNQLDGFAVRLSFQQKINADWEWQAGLMLGGTRFKHEYVGDIQGTEWTPDNPNSWRDTYSGTPVEGGLKVSPYAGVSVKVTDHSSFEVNLLALNYSSINYVHHPGSGTYDFDPGSDGTAGKIAPHNAVPGDSLVKKNRLSPQLEFGYVFHF